LGINKRFNLTVQKEIYSTLQQKSYTYLGFFVYHLVINYYYYYYYYLKQLGEEER